MKTHHAIVILLGLLLGQVLSSHAQNIVDNKVYRVTAYKRGNNTITSTSNYAEVSPPLSMYIPSAFSPNGDGINDMFGVKGEGIKDFQILIYNRWGEVIFETTEARKQWDGKYNGNPVEQGTYVYKLFASGVKKPRTGAVTVIY